MEQFMKPEQKQEKSKRPYEKPMLRVIELSAEEVLAVGCKQATGASAFGNAVGCIATPCAAQGS
jgi:hypothetical protein